VCPTHLLAALHGVPAWQVQAKLASLLGSWGAKAVLDVSEARSLALSEAAHEFIER